MITIHQRYRQTDRQTDRQTTCDRNTAHCTKVHRAVKIGFRVHWGGCDDQQCRRRHWDPIRPEVTVLYYRLLVTSPKTKQISNTIVYFRIYSNTTFSLQQQMFISRHNVTITRAPAVANERRVRRCKDVQMSNSACSLNCLVLMSNFSLGFFTEVSTVYHFDCMP